MEEDLKNQVQHESGTHSKQRLNNKHCAYRLTSIQCTTESTENKELQNEQNEATVRSCFSTEACSHFYTFFIFCTSALTTGRPV